jgi:hypothetical protein
MRQPVGRNDAAKPMERIVRSEPAHHREKDALLRITGPVFPGRWIPSAGVVASGPAAIGQVTSCSAACHPADSSRSIRRTTGRNIKTRGRVNQYPSRLEPGQAELYAAGFLRGAAFIS